MKKAKSVKMTKREKILTYHEHGRTPEYIANQIPCSLGYVRNVLAAEHKRKREVRRVTATPAVSTTLPKVKVKVEIDDPTANTRGGILDTAKDYVSNDRESTYGAPEDNFANIAAYWSQHLGHPVTSTDVAIMMTLLKLARLKATPASRDGWVDGAGYMACGGEIALREAGS